MTITELNEITRADWLMSLWPIYLITIAAVLGLFARRR